MNIHLGRLFGLLSFALLPAAPTFAASITFDQCSSCGDPGSALQVFFSGLNPNTHLAIGFINNTFIYNPAVSGPVSSIDASVDKNLTISQSSPFSPSSSYQSNFSPLLEQDGNFYFANIVGPVLHGNGTSTTLTTGYGTLSKAGLVASDFFLFNFLTDTAGTTHPNFAGDPIGLGLISAANIGSPSSISNATIESDYDNLAFTINDPIIFTDGTFNLANYSEVTFNSTIPEPGAVLLLSSGLIWLINRKSRSRCSSSIRDARMRGTANGVAVSSASDPKATT